MMQTMYGSFSVGMVMPSSKAFSAASVAAACSSGEEPYSIALLLADYYATKPNAQWTVDCTDISTKVLKKASEGIFEADRLNQVPPDMVTKSFQKGFGQWEGYYRVREEVKKHLTFQRLNLLGKTYPFREQYDVIFCRNNCWQFNT